MQTDDVYIINDCHVECMFT